MIVTSLKNTDIKYIWIKVPRTASKSYSDLFFANYNPKTSHFHIPFAQINSKYKNIPGFAVVRHPVTKFISGLKYITNHLIGNSLNSDYDVKIPLDSIKTLCDFLNNNFEMNCNLLNISLCKIFNTKDDIIISSFFKTQANYCYHPKVKVFHYENLGEFNYWIEDVLGYDTSNIKKIGSEEKNYLTHLNFKDPYFIKTVEKLFYIDYKVFNYPLVYLT